MSLMPLFLLNGEGRSKQPEIKSQSESAYRRLTPNPVPNFTLLKCVPISVSAALDYIEFANQNPVVDLLEAFKSIPTGAQEIGFSAPNSCSLPWLVEGATQLCTSKKECNKLDLTAAQYF